MSGPEGSRWCGLVLIWFKKPLFFRETKIQAMTPTLPCVDKFTECKHQGPSEAKGLILLTEGARAGDGSHGHRLMMGAWRWLEMRKESMSTDQGMETQASLLSEGDQGQLAVARASVSRGEEQP